MRMERRDFMSVNIMQVEKYCRTVIDMCLLFIIFSFKRKFEILYGLLVGKKKKKKNLSVIGIMVLHLTMTLYEIYIVFSMYNILNVKGRLLYACMSL